MGELPAAQVLVVVGERLQPVEHVDVALDAPLENVGGEVGLAHEFGVRLAFHLAPREEPCKKGGRDPAGEGQQCDILGPQVRLHSSFKGVPR